MILASFDKICLISPLTILMKGTAMFKKKTLLTVAATAILSACSSTTVVKDISGPKVVDVMYAKFAEEVQTALNRLADVEDMNKVNVINALNANTQPLNESYNGTVEAQRSIRIPDTYPQTQWRNDGVNTTAQDSVQAIKDTAEKQEEQRSVLQQAVKKSNAKIRASKGIVPPPKFECPEGQESISQGRMTICQ